MTYAQWSTVYNALSFGIAGMGIATIFFWLQFRNVSKNYQTAVIITGSVTCIATNLFLHMFNTLVVALIEYYEVTLPGTPFNDAFSYVDWLLAAPLSLIELVLVSRVIRLNSRSDGCGTLRRFHVSALLRAPFAGC